jgi:DNA-binding beta-propeller fold protein YncE
MQSHFRISIHVPAALCLTVLFAITAMISGCSKDDNPVEPDELGEPKDYVVYFTDDVDPTRWFTLHTATGVYDALEPPPQKMIGMRVSADGSKLYVPASASTTVLSSDSLNVIAEIPYLARQEIVVSKDDRYIALLDDGFFILSTADYSLVYSDTDEAASARFSADNHALYFTGHDHWGRVELDANPVVTERFAIPVSTRGRCIIPSVDESRVFLYLWNYTLQYTYTFAVYDLALDSMVFTEPIVPGAGYLETTPDGRYVFYTNGGGAINGPDPPKKFTIYDVHQNKILTRIKTDIVLYDTELTDFDAWRMAITPDGRKLILTEAPGLHRYIVYDIAKMQITDFRDVGASIRLRDITIQSQE